MDLNSKYRPQTFDDVLGHRSTIKSLKNILANRDLLPHAFMFSGESGIGKTSLARILAKELGVKPVNIVEQDALTHSTNEAMKELIGTMRYPAMGGSPYRAVILDEVQSLSKTIWQTILKDIEEPPAHLFWILCTTEYDKLPNTLLTRLHHYVLKPVSTVDILKMLHEIRFKEGFNVSPESLTKIADKANGSPRLAIALLSATRSSASDEEVDELLENTMSEGIKNLCAYVCSEQCDLRLLTPTLHGVAHESAEVVRRNIVWYATKKFFLTPGKERDLKRYAQILERYGDPVHSEDGIAPLLRLVYRDLAYQGP